MKKKKNKDLEYYMSLNYPFTVELYKENGELRFGLQVPELQGVWADGKTVEEAYADLIETKRLWFETCLEKGIDIPEPVLEKDFSGKFILRLEPKLHMTLSKRAQRSNISLNQYIRTLLEKQIGNSDLIAEIRQLGKLTVKQSEAIDNLRKELTSLDHRIGSLEEAFSSISDVRWGKSVFVTIGEPFQEEVIIFQPQI
jgi:predicted HicB family RNase H-like nuclease